MAKYINVDRLRSVIDELETETLVSTENLKMSSYIDPEELKHRLNVIFDKGVKSLNREDIFDVIYECEHVAVVKLNKGKNESYYATK